MWFINFENVKGYKSPAIDQIPAELIKEGGSKITSDIQTSESSVIYIYSKVIKQIIAIIEAYQFISYVHNSVQILLSSLTP
jgi:hypothetical protein